MGKGKACLVTYRETYGSMGKTVFEVIKYICREKSYSYEELKKVFPDEIANHGPKFVEHPCVIKEENEVIYKDLEPKKRFFLDTIILAKDNSTIFVSNQWNEDNFSEFCKVASEKFDIEIELL